jgi:hypothetical protein
MFLDLFGCNMLGIWLGALTIKHMGISRINWIYKKEKPTKANLCTDPGPMRRALSKLSPEVLMKHDWEMFANFKRYA